VWQPGRAAPEIAGELLVARRPDGQSLVQFIKTPFPILSAQATPTRWQIEIPSQRRSHSGRGKPPARLIWLHLADCLFESVPPPTNWTFQRISPAALQPSQPNGLGQRTDPQAAAVQFRFENKESGEILEGFLSP
jgi:hypothetical protein